MLINEAVSNVAQALAHIIDSLQDLPEVETAVLSTVDGLAVNGSTPPASQIAAVASFMMSAANQSSVILGRQGSYEITIEMVNETTLVCWPFEAGDAQLILTVIFKQKMAYKRLLAQTIRTIQQAVES
jgi:predicted regulator of Ras-like GTPase activity (Roadblock/LC7/MglB family)